MRIPISAGIKKSFNSGRAILHKEGFSSLLKAIISAYTPHLFKYRCYLIFVNNLDGPKFACKVDNLTLKIISHPEELEQLSAENFNFQDYKRAFAGFPNEGTLFIAFIDKNVVHGTRVFHHKYIDYMHLCPSLPDNRQTAYIDRVWTAPEYRRRGINAFVSSEIFYYVKNGGGTRAITVVDKSNTAEVNCQLKLGSCLWYRRYCLTLLQLLNLWGGNP